MPSWLAQTAMTAAILSVYASSPPALAAPTFTTVYTVPYGLSGGSEGPTNIAVAGGNIYAITPDGGLDGSGVLFQLDPATGVENTLTTFSGNSHGAVPVGMVLVGDTLYISNSTGGKPNAAGTIFQYGTVSGESRVLYHFRNKGDGTFPNQLIDVSGVLYGSSPAGGGSGNAGTVFAVDERSGKEQTLYQFTGGSDGGAPSGPLAYVNGALYGVVTQVAQNTMGAIFKLDLATGTETIIHQFAGRKDGDGPFPGLIYANGMLYGVTYNGGAKNAGTVFSLDPGSAAFLTLHTFKDGHDGALPAAPPVYASGALYGTTARGGAGGAGIVYKLPLATLKEKVLHEFTYGSDGAESEASLIYDGSAFYGATTAGGTQGAGTLFAITP